MSTQTPTLVPFPLTSPDFYPPEFWKKYYAKVVVDDGEPVDGFFSEREMRLLPSSLYASWAGPGDDRPFIALANVGLFYAPDLPPIVPDVMLSLDVRLLPSSLGKKSQSYFLWEYRKAPDWALEIVSNARSGEDTRKLRIYQSIGIPYYVLHDPDQIISDQVLRVYALEKGKYRLRKHTWFPLLNLGITLWHGSFEGWSDTWLRWVDADGNLILTGEEQAQHAKEQAKLAKETGRRAKKAMKEAERLAAKLRELGIDPDKQ
jgi:Uma2 family endonuclease